METNVHKTEGIRELGSIDIALLKKKVEQLSDIDWDTEEDYAANYNKDKGALLNTSHIILKFSNKQSNPFQYFECSRWKEWSEVLLPIMDQATSQFDYAHGFYPRVMLAKLSPKKFIGTHTDGDDSGSIPHKVHIPLETNKNSYFFIEEQRFNLLEGFAYEVNNRLKHSVANNGTTDRIHLIFEYLDFDAQSEVIKHQVNIGERLKDG